MSCVPILTTSKLSLLPGCKTSWYASCYAVCRGFGSVPEFGRYGRSRAPGRELFSGFRDRVERIGRVKACFSRVGLRIRSFGLWPAALRARGSRSTVNHSMPMGRPGTCSRLASHAVEFGWAAEPHTVVYYHSGQRSMRGAASARGYRRCASLA